MLYNNFIQNLKDSEWSYVEVCGHTCLSSRLSSVICAVVQDNYLKKLYFENVAFKVNSTSEITVKDYQTLFETAPGAAFKYYTDCTSFPWRNISHILNRSSYDCRRRFLYIAFGIDLSKLPDSWLTGEVSMQSATSSR